MNRANHFEPVGDVWHVLLPTGEERQITLAELDALFGSGTIGERTFVKHAGMDRWEPLGQVTGLAPGGGVLAPVISARETQPSEPFDLRPPRHSGIVALAAGTMIDNS